MSVDSISSIRLPPPKHRWKICDFFGRMSSTPKTLGTLKNRKRHYISEFALFIQNTHHFYPIYLYYTLARWGDFEVFLNAPAHQTVECAAEKRKKKYSLSHKQEAIPLVLHACMILYDVTFAIVLSCITNCIISCLVVAVRGLRSPLVPYMYRIFECSSFSQAYVKCTIVSGVCVIGNKQVYARLSEKHSSPLVLSAPFSRFLLLPNSPVAIWCARSSL